MGTCSGKNRVFLVSRGSLCITIKGESNEEGGQIVPCIILPASSEISSDFPASLFPLHFLRPFVEGGPSISPRSIPFASIPSFPELVLLFWSPAPAQRHHLPLGHAIRRSARFLKCAFYQKKKIKSSLVSNASKIQLGCILRQTPRSNYYHKSQA